MGADQDLLKRPERGVRGLKGVADPAGQCSVVIHFDLTVRAVSQAVAYLAYLIHITITSKQDQSVSQLRFWLKGLLLISKASSGGILSYK